jgi:hypothetical protein
MGGDDSKGENTFFVKIIYGNSKNFNRAKKFIYPKINFSQTVDTPLIHEQKRNML